METKTTRTTCLTRDTQWLRVMSKTEREGEGEGDILKIIMAHISVKCIPLQALETPVCEVLAGIIVLAGTLTVFQLANLKY